MSTTLTGRLTRDPELTFTSGGVARARFGIAVTRRRKKGEEWVEQTSFFDAVCWREQAENVGESLAKGDGVIVTGRFEQRTFDGRDGTERTVFELSVDEVGPSLRWATATVNRNERKAGQAPQGRGVGRSVGDFGEEPW